MEAGRELMQREKGYGLRQAGLVDLNNVSNSACCDLRNALITALMQHDDNDDPMRNPMQIVKERCFTSVLTDSIY